MPSNDPGRNRHLDARAPAVRRLVGRRGEEHAGRPAPLDRLAGVIADVDAATDSRCACGCGAPITDSSPSAYYATPECQQAWMARHAHNPHEVYRRRDAADYPMTDSGVQTLNEPGAPAGGYRFQDELPGRGRMRSMVGSRAVDIPPNIGGFFERMAHRDHVHVSMIQPARRLIYGPGRFSDVLAYRTTCPACDDFMEPLIYDVDDVGERGLDPDYRVHAGPAWEQECSSCGAAMLGTVHFPTVRREAYPARWVLELHTAYGRVRSTLTSLVLDMLADDQARSALVARTWASMEHDLARFEREWRGRLTRSQTRMMQRMLDAPTSGEILREILGGGVQ